MPEKKTILAMLSLITALAVSWAVTWIFLTPYCGWLFHCGCTWLWAGAAEKCIGGMDAACVMHQCPWCSDGQWGMLIPLFFMLAIQTVIIWLLWWRWRAQLIWLLLAGLVAFLASGYLESIIHAWIKGYPR